MPSGLRSTPPGPPPRGVADPLFDPPAPPRPAVEVRRSARRKRTVSAYRDGDTVVVLVPARMSRADERHWVEVMLERLEAGARRHQRGDDDLLERAALLSERYLGGRATPSSVRWVSNQVSRWGSCTVEDRSIRLSDRLRPMPAYVVDYVLLHELAHLLVPSHGAPFWALLEGYPRLERARGYLEGWPAGAAARTADTEGLPPTDSDDTD